MRWGVLVFALFAVMVVQPAVVGFLPAALARSIDLFLLLAIACALLAPAGRAPLAACIIGFGQDLLSSGPVGVHAAGLALGALLVVRLRVWVNYDVWWVQVLLGVILGLTTLLVSAVLTGLNVRLWHGTESHIWSDARAGFVAALLAAGLAAAVLQLPVLGLSRPGRLRRARGRW